MEAALEGIGRYEWLALTSPAGVDALWHGLRAMGRDARAMGGVKLAAAGPGTAKALAACGLAADLVPPVYDGTHLGHALAGVARGRVLLLRAEVCSPELPEILGRAGIAYDDIPVYRTRYGGSRSQALRAALGGFDFITFTSASTVKGLLAAVGEDADFSRVTGLCIGEQTAAEARRHGIPVRVAGQATIDALAELAAVTDA